MTTSPAPLFRRVGTPVAALTLAALVAACSSGSAPSAVASALASAAAASPASDAPSEAPTDTPVATSPASSDEPPSESPLPSAVATDIDPCQLVTKEDASAFVGTTFGAGKESTTESNLRICTYAAPGPNLFQVQVAIAPDEATAKAAEAAAEQDLDSQAQDMANLGLTVTKLPNFAAGTEAALMQGKLSQAGVSIAARAMLLLRGTTFLAFSDVAVGGGQPPSEQAMKDEANELLAKVP